jgi:outer membrane protein
VRLEWPLFDGFARASRRRATVAQTQAAEAELALALRDTQAMLWKVYEEVSAGRKKLDLSKEMVANAETAFDLAEGRYRSGIGSLLELFKAKQDLDNQQLEAVQAANDAHTASFALAIALGIFQ